MRGSTVYAKKTGVEIVTVTRKKQKGEYLQRYGAIRMRFFRMEEDKSSVRVILKPVEAAKLGRVLKKLIDSPKAAKVQIFYHEYENKEGNKVSTTLTAEKWVKDKKSGYALVLVQKNGGEVKINVPMDKDNAYYVALLMEHLAVEQSWFKDEKISEEEESVDDTDGPAPTPEEIEEVPDDIEF